MYRIFKKPKNTINKKSKLVEANVVVVDSPTKLSFAKQLPSKLN